jgi:hypothetical protein
VSIIRQPALGRPITWWALRVAGGAIIVAASFFATLFAMDSYEAYSPPRRDALRVEQTKIIKAALEKYRAAKGRYPSPFADNPLSDLKEPLVNGGFLASIPLDPLSPAKQYRYTTDGAPDGLRYGLLIPREVDGPCKTGVGADNIDYFGIRRNCPF